MKGHSLLFLFISLCTLSSLFSQSGLSIEPEEIVLEEGSLSPLFHEGISINIKNLDSRMVEVILIPSREGMIISPSSYTYSCTEDITFLIRFEGEIPEPENMFFPFVVMNKTDRITQNYLIYHPLAYTPPSESQVSLNPDNYDIILTYYYSPSCKSCREFLEKEIPRLEKELNLSIGMELRNVFDQKNMDSLHTRLEEAGLDSDALPLLDTGSVILAGESMITNWLEEALTGNPVPQPSDTSNRNSSQNPLWLMVAGAGLLDGINPCAFSTLIFLLAYLGLRKRSRREILKVGIAFSFTVFVTYTAVGAGAFLLLRESLSFSWISEVLKWGGAGALFLLSLLSFRDWGRVRRGELKELTLQLSPSIKKALHKSVREGVGSVVPLLGACGMGFMVTIYELGCTGQIYLPTLYLMTRSGEKGSWSLLILYNLIFILPLGIVFFLAYKGLTSDRLGKWFQERLGLVKLITAFFFLIAGIIILLV